VERHKLFQKISGIYEAISNLREDQSQRNLDELKKELNKFFTDSKCLEVLYTKNTDKIFFGMCVIPRIDRAHDMLYTNEKIVFKDYYLEIDSKLFEPTLELTNDEITAIVLHEVGHIVNNSQPTESLRKSIDIYLAKNKTKLSPEDYQGATTTLLNYAISDAIRKQNSMFFIKDEEVIADEFVHYYGLGSDLQSALRKINSKALLINKDVDNKLVVLSWALRLTATINLVRLPALRTLQKGEHLVNTQLEKRQIQAIQRILLDGRYVSESGMLDSIKAKLDGMFKQIRYKGVRGLEDDLYEYNMRIRNVETEDDALLLIREINSRIAILDDYIHSEKFEGEELHRWLDTVDKFKKQREMLSNKITYKQKASMINVSYPEITMKY
jgi:hypothetical protein